MTTHLYLAILIASVLSIIIQACGGGGTGSACANAAQQFEANPTDGTAQIVRQSCRME